MSLTDLQQMDVDNLLHPFTALKLHESNGPNIIDHGEGIYLTDSTGHTFIDGFSGLWCVNIGYGREEVVEATAAQMRKLPYCSSFNGTSNEPAIRLAKKLIDLSPASLQHAFFTLGGSDAVDTALKIIPYYFNCIGKPEKKNVISLMRSYHGVTRAGAGQTGLPVCHTNFDTKEPWQHHISSHDPYRNPHGPTDAGIIESGVAELEDKIAELGGPEKVAAFIVEPIQGAGGVVVPPKGWLKAMRETCAKHDILFMADEVICGFGRTGEWFGCDHEDLQPDIMSLAKGLTSGYVPMGALLISDEIYRVLTEQAPEGLPFCHGFTYSAHPVSAAAALAVIDIYEKENLVENSREVGAYLAEALKNAVGDHPWFGNIRNQGLLCAIELVKDPESKEALDPKLTIAAKIYKAAYKNGLSFRAIPGDILGFAPPLTLTKAEADLIVERLRKSIDEVYAAEM